MLRSTLCILACFGATLTAQSSAVVPADHATKPGNSLEQQVFGFDQSRYVQFVDKAELGTLATGSSLKEIRYRREENRLDKIFSAYEPMRRLTSTPLPNWEIQVSNFTGNYANLIPNYNSAANGVNLTTVFAAQLNLVTHCPTLPPPASSSQPAPFDLKFPFNIQPYVYSGRGLCVSHRVYATRNFQHRYYVDSIYSQPSNSGTVEKITPTSVGCPTGFNRVYGTAPNPGGGNVSMHLFGAPPNAATLSFLGTSAPTPVHLDFMGLPSCYIYTDFSIPISRQTDLAGIASWNATVPANPGLSGIELYSQWIVADDRVSQATPLGFSDGMRIKLGTKIGANNVRMSVVSGLGNQARNNVGFFRPNQGAVFQLIY